MTSAAQSDGRSLASKATVQSSRKTLIEKSFQRILETLRQLSLHERSPKLFIIYAHDNESLGLKAYQDTVKEYISWFKAIRFNVDSDKSPHGYGVAHDVGHAGASNDIFMNQVCLLPRSWHTQNVDYVVLFYSPVLAKYMKDERSFKLKDKTYSDAVIETCQRLQSNFRHHSQVEWDNALGEIRTVQKTYAEAMKSSFHHVMTETALLSFTNRYGAINKTIPIILSGDETWERDLKWQPHFIYNRDTQLRITIKPEEEYQQFFKILLELETLERDRPLIDVLKTCFEHSLQLLKEDSQPERFISHVELGITDALRSLNNQWQKLKRPITRGDIRGRLDLYSKLESVRLISGERLPESVKDIDLAVPRRLSSGDKRQGGNEQEDMQIVPLRSLFDEIEVGNKNIRPQRILIQGRPGIGKTTLCRRLMYEYSWQENLRTKFDLVVRIPVRKLKYSADLNNLLFEEYFQDTSKGRDLSKELEKLILAHVNVNMRDEAVKSVSILIILDGLDEAAVWSKEGHAAHALLEKLMKGTAVIITSRFFDTKMPHVSVDLTLEALGFSSINVDAYLDSTDNIPSDKAQQIHRVIEANPFVKDMVRVPIHLDILCYSWDELYEQNTATITADGEGGDFSPKLATLYQAVVRSLWRKDIPSLGKLDNGKEVTAEIVNAVKDTTRLERLFHTESNLLEEIAIGMVESDRLEFTDEDVTKVIRRWESNGDSPPLSLEGSIHQFSLLRSYSADRDGEFSFIHLTFQDFFAARYTVRSLAQDPSRLKILLRQYKYNRRYENFWRFIPGLLSEVKDLDTFFNLLDEEPRDLVGAQHIQLMMYCLNECRDHLKPSRWDEFQKRFEDWHRLELRMGNVKGIGSSIEFPENILREQLKKSSLKVLSRLLRTIANRTLLSEDFIYHLTRWVSRDGSHRLALRALQVTLSDKFLHSMQKDSSAIWILGQVEKLPDDTISFLMKQISCKTANSKYTKSIKNVLQMQHYLPNWAIKELSDWLQSDDNYMSRIASSILEKQATLSKDTIDHVIEHLIREGSKTVKTGRKRSRDAMSCSWVCYWHDLHPEAVAKVLRWLVTQIEQEQYTRELLPIAKAISRLPLQPNDVEYLATLLEKCLLPLDSAWIQASAGLAFNSEPDEVRLKKAFAISVFEGQANLPTSVLKMAVRLLDEEDDTVREIAQRVLQRQPEISQGIITELQHLFKDGRFEKRKMAIALALKGRLHLLHEVFIWISNETLSWLIPPVVSKKDAAFNLSKALNCLRGESDLPDYLVKALMNKLQELFVEEKISFEEVAHLLGHQRKLSDEVLNCLIESFQSYDHFSSAKFGVPGLLHRQIFADPLIRALETAKSEDQAETFVSGLMLQANLDQDLHERLRNLISNPSARKFRSQQASRIFNHRNELEPKDISALHTGLYLRRESFRPLWRDRHMGQFFANLEAFKPVVINKIIKIMLARPPEELTPGYIDSNTLFFSASDGKLTEQRLEDEKAFRERFLKAQRKAQIPK